jgi:HlyD family secretion protein
VAAALVGLSGLACDNTRSDDFLGSAVVEVRTFQIASSVQGQICEVLKDEGARVVSGELVAVIDTVPMVLKLGEVEALMAELNQNVAAKRPELAALSSDVQGLKRERDRASGLVEKGSAPVQQLDALSTQYESAGLRAKAGERALLALAAKRKVLLAQQEQVLESIRRCYLRAPYDGVVLTRYRSQGEMAGPTLPVFEIGSYDTVQVDFFVPQPMLADLRIGQSVRIRLDESTGRTSGKQAAFLPATVSWISPDAEFSPKNIQTRESRTDLVFRVRARAPNAEGMLKRGLPVEVWR